VEITQNSVERFAGSSHWMNVRINAPSAKPTTGVYVLRMCIQDGCGDYQPNHHYSSLVIIASFVIIDSMIILVTGFVSEHEDATFEGRIQPESCDADILISCFYNQEMTGTQFFKAEYPQDTELLVGFLTWLKCRNRSPTITLTNFHWKLEDSSDKLNKARSDIDGRIPSSTTSEKFLLQFAKFVRLQGNERYKEGRYERAINLYHSALLSLSEWDVVTKADEWRGSSLDCFSNILQAYIQLNQHMKAKPNLSSCIQLVLSATKVEPQKQAKCLYRCALIAEACGNFRTARTLGVLATRYHTNEHVNQLNQRLQQLVDPTTTWTNEQDECLVCLDHLFIGKVLQLSCKHRFHQSCIVPWLKDLNTCPNCRAVLDRNLDILVE